MLSHTCALNLIEAAARGQPELAAENEPLLEAVGRVLARDLFSADCIPPFDNAAMDGYAVRSGDVKAEGDHILPVLGTVLAGDTPLPLPASPASPCAWEITTGAPFPAGFDACVRVEDVILEKNSSGEITRAQIRGPVPARLNRRVAGEDFQPGQPVLPKGTRIRPEHLITLASLGFNELPLYRKLRVGILTTGKELVPMESAPPPGKIRNSNAPYLLASLRARGVEAVHLGTIPDEPEAFASSLAAAAAAGAKFDLLLSTGAVSMGRADFVTGALESFGAEILFHKLAIRPAKPLLFARLPAGGAYFFGLPGNPVSAAVGLRFYVDHFLRLRQGAGPEAPRRGRLLADVPKPPGVRCFYKARANEGGVQTTVDILSRKMSFMQQSLLNDTAWVVLPEEGSVARAGSEIDFFPF